MSCPYVRTVTTAAAFLIATAWFLVPACQKQIKEQRTKGSGEGVPLQQAQKDILRSAPAGAKVEFAFSFEIKNRQYPILAVSYPVDQKANPFLPVAKDYVMDLYVYLHAGPAKIQKHALLKPSATGPVVWEDVSPGPLSLYRLKTGQQYPVVLAQSYWYEDAYYVRYVVFDTNRLLDPESGICCYSTSLLPTARHEYFTPNRDPGRPGEEKNEFQNDGVTVAHGQQGRMTGRDARGEERYQIRAFRAVWSGQKLIYQYSPWKIFE